MLRPWARTAAERGRLQPLVEIGGLLPPEIHGLVRSLGLELSRVVEITSLPGLATPRRTWRLELDGAGVAKGRLVRDLRTAEAMERWLPLLPGARFPRLLARQGVATLEAWRAGCPCRDSGVSVLEAAGSLLREVHGLLETQEIAANDRRLEKWGEGTETWIETLRLGGALTEGLARSLLQTTRELRPRGATWGLRHGDFCLENLIESENGLCCIDNVTVGPGILESDLGHTFYRWPMQPRAREAFLAGYRHAEVLSHFLEHEDFWIIASALLGAVRRLRGKTGGLEAPLRILESRVR